MRQRLENLRLITKMVFPIAVMLAVALGIVAFAERSLDKLRAQTHEIIRVTAARQALALSASASANGVAANEKNAMLMTDKTGLDVFASGYVTEIDHLKADIAGLQSLTAEPRELEALAAMAQAVEAYFATGERLYQLMVDREYEAAHALSTGEAQDARDRLIQLIGEEVVRSTAKMQQAEGQADALYERTVGLLIALSVGGLFCAILMVSWITSRLIIRPLAAMAQAVEAYFATGERLYQLMVDREYEACATRCSARSASAIAATRPTSTAAARISSPSSTTYSIWRRSIPGAWRCASMSSTSPRSAAPRCASSGRAPSKPASPSR